MLALCWLSLEAKSIHENPEHAVTIHYMYVRLVNAPFLL